MLRGEREKMGSAFSILIAGGSEEKFAGFQCSVFREEKMGLRGLRIDGLREG